MVSDYFCFTLFITHVCANALQRYEERRDLPNVSKKNSLTRLFYTSPFWMFCTLLFVCLELSCMFALHSPIYLIISLNSSSETMRIPSFCAFSSFAGPMLFPASTNEVLAEMLPTFLPPCCSMKALYSSRLC